MCVAEKKEFMKVILLCHSVVVMEHKGVRKYEGTSADEEAMLKGIEQEGWLFLGRSGKVAKVQFNSKGGHIDEQEEYKVLLDIPFESKRGRMTVVVEHGETCEVLIKGSDQQVLPLTRLDATERERAFEAIGAFAETGLRTLVMGRRNINRVLCFTYADSRRSTPASSASPKPSALVIKRPPTRVWSRATKS